MELFVLSFWSYRITAGPSFKDPQTVPKAHIRELVS